MIVEKQTEVVILTDGDEAASTINATLDLDSAHVLMQMLSKGLYSDAIGSTIRETASNALDSHRRANVTDVPIIVSLKRNSEDNFEFSVEDFGTGLDDVDVVEVISKYGKSTKRTSADELGMFGLGFKSPLAYSNSFIFVCRKDGYERKYMMYEGEDFNKFDLLHQCPTTERNGVKIIIPVKYTDVEEFYSKINQQLAYFESVYFDVDSVYSKSIDNNFSIIRSEDFQASGLSSTTVMHVCLDNVYYPLDFEKLEIVPIYIPIGLRFSLTDGLFPTPNRENLRYTAEAKATILAKISVVAEHFVEKYNETISDTTDAYTAINSYFTRDKYLNDYLDNRVDIGAIVNYSSVKAKSPSIKGITHLKLYSIASNINSVLYQYTCKYNYGNGRFTEAKNSWNTSVSYRDLKNDNFIFSDKFTAVKKAYYRDTLKSYNKFIKKDKKLPLFPGKLRGNSYFEILSLHNVPRVLWRTHIKELQHLTSLLEEGFTNVDSFDVPQSWIDERTKLNQVVVGNTIRRAPKLSGEVIGKVGVELLRTSYNKNCKFEPITLKLDEISKHKSLYIYGSDENSIILDGLYGVTNGKQPVKVIIFSKRELANVSKLKLHNLINVEKFMEGDHKVFRRVVTAAIINKIIYNNSYVFLHNKLFDDVSLDIAEKLRTLIEYEKNNYSRIDEPTSNAMIEVALDKQLFDTTIYPEAIQMRELLAYLPFLNTLVKNMVPKYSYAYSQEDGIVARDVICDLFKYYKIKLNLDRYGLKLNEEEVEVLEEKVIDQLTN